ncbi:hypothetical protein D3C81_2109980 [compost metagenome]
MLEDESYLQLTHDKSYGLSGGGFPINENGEIKGCICVSGLEHEQDHQLIVDALTKFLKGA